MAKKIVTPATISRRALVPFAASPKNLSSIPPASPAPGSKEKGRAAARPFSDFFPSLNLAALIGDLPPVGGIFIDWVDTGVSGLSHAIFGVIAVQHTQGNYRIYA